MKAYLFVLILWLCPFKGWAQPTSVQVNITGVAVGKGPIVINIYDSADRFFKEVAYSKTVDDDQPTITALLEIPAGQYAISVYQDINRNKRLDQGWFNIPKEPVGFGNNFRPRTSAPRFEDCALLVKAGKNRFTIELFTVF